MKNRLPNWFRQEIITNAALKKLSVLSEAGVHTVCSEAKCPNLNSCFKESRFTFLILGDKCTRNCRFCGVDKLSGGNSEIDKHEPYRVSEIVKNLGLKYVVVTSVTRDDLSDGGSGQFVTTIEAIRDIDRHIAVEVLIPDFLGNINSLDKVINAKPTVLAHNMETVRRLYPAVRPEANYEVSLSVFSRAKEINSLLPTKSSLILGLGEGEEEVILTMEDLRAAGCDILTLGQYLSPGPGYYPVKEFLSPLRFDRYRDIGIDMGFKGVLSGPLVRSSYRAEHTYREAINA